MIFKFLHVLQYVIILAYRYIVLVEVYLILFLEEKEIYSYSILKMKTHPINNKHPIFMTCIIFYHLLTSIYYMNCIDYLFKLKICYSSMSELTILWSNFIIFYHRKLGPILLGADLLYTDFKIFRQLNFFKALATKILIVKLVLSLSSL